MEARITAEFSLLREAYPDIDYKERWVHVPHYPLPHGWNHAAIDVAFFIRDGFPGISPYGIYVPSDLCYAGAAPNNFTPSSNPQPPFPGKWGVFSWEASEWRAAPDPRMGHNLLNWVQGFSRRFAEGL